MPLSDDDKNRFVRALLAENAYRKQYYAGQISFTFRTPSVRGFDAVLAYLGKKRTELDNAQLLRLSQTLQIRLYLEKIEGGDRTRNFVPVAHLLQQDTSLDKLAKSLRFMNEALYAILHKTAEEFKRHVDALATETLETDRLSEFMRKYLGPGGILESIEENKTCPTPSPPDTDGLSISKIIPNTSKPSSKDFAEPPAQPEAGLDYSSETEGEKKQPDS